MASKTSVIYRLLFTRPCCPRAQLLGLVSGCSLGVGGVEVKRRGGWAVETLAGRTFHFSTRSSGLKHVRYIKCRNSNTGAESLLLLQEQLFFTLTIGTESCKRHGLMFFFAASLTHFLYTVPTTFSATSTTSPTTQTPYPGGPPTLNLFATSPVTSPNPFLPR